MLDKRYNDNGSPSAHVHLAALFFSLLLSCLASCHGGNTDESGDGDSIMLRVGVMPTGECMRLFYAQRTGMADSLGLHLVLLRSVADVDTALNNGSVDVALTDTVRLHRFHNDFTVLEHAHDTLWLVATDSSKVRGAGGLKDKLVGMLRYSDAQTAVDRLSQHAQYKEGDVFFIQVGDVTQRYKMLAARLLDAAFLPHPYSDAAIALGHRRIRLVPTDTLCQGVWVARNVSKDKIKPLLTILKDTTTMQPDTLQAILADIYLLPQQALDSLGLHTN